MGGPIVVVSAERSAAVMLNKLARRDGAKALVSASAASCASCDVGDPRLTMDTSATTDCTTSVISTLGTLRLSATALLLNVGAERLPPSLSVRVTVNCAKDAPD